MKDEIDFKNVEEVVEKAIEKYFDKRMIADALFWKHCLPLLKEKWQKECEKKWKCWVWDQYEDVIMSSDCLQQIVDKLKELDKKNQFERLTKKYKIKGFDKRGKK